VGQGRGYRLDLSGGKNKKEELSLGAEGADSYDKGAGTARGKEKKKKVSCVPICGRGMLSSQKRREKHASSGKQRGERGTA